MKIPATSSGSTRRRNNSFYQITQAIRRSMIRPHAICPAVSIRIRRMKNAREQRAKSLALHSAARGQRKRAHRAPVKRAVKRNQLVALGVIFRQLDGRFDRLPCPNFRNKRASAIFPAQSPQASAPIPPATDNKNPSPTCESTQPPASESPRQLPDGNARWRPPRSPPQNRETYSRPRPRSSRRARASPPADNRACKKAKSPYRPLQPASSHSDPAAPSPNAANSFPKRVFPS